MRWLVLGWGGGSHKAAMGHGRLVGLPNRFRINVEGVGEETASEAFWWSVPLDSSVRVLRHIFNRSQMISQLSNSKELQNNPKPTAARIFLALMALSRITLISLMRFGLNWRYFG